MWRRPDPDEILDDPFLGPAIPSRSSSLGYVAEVGIQPFTPLPQAPKFVRVRVKRTGQVLKISYQKYVEVMNRQLQEKVREQAARQAAEDERRWRQQQEDDRVYREELGRLRRIAEAPNMFDAVRREIAYQEDPVKPQPDKTYPLVTKRKIRTE